MIAVIVIIGSLISLYVTQLRPANKSNLAPFVGAGQVLADETAKAIGDHGRVVLLVSALARSPNSVEQQQLAGFLGEIKRHRQIQIVATETFKIIAPPIEDAMRDLGLTNEQFAELLRKYDDVDALVTFIELPAFNPGQPLEWPRVHPKIIAGQLPVQAGQAYLRANKIAAFIAKREESTTTAKTKPRTPREWFDKYFQLFTLQNLAAQPQISDL